MIDSVTAPLLPPPPLLSLAPTSSIQDNVSTCGVWNVITKASDIVKDGERIENLAWRHWSRPRRQPSSSSINTESSGSVQTPIQNDLQTFGGALKLLLEHNEFKDWVGEAKLSSSYLVSPPPSRTPNGAKTPHPAHLEIRLVEPTPVPSRVGSLGTSQQATFNNLLTTSGATAAQIPPALDELDERESASPSPTSSSWRPARRGKFFVHQSSPSKASASDSSPVAPPSLTTQPPPPPPPATAAAASGPVDTVDVADVDVENTTAPPGPPSTSTATSAHQLRRSSGSSTGASKKKRHVSLSTMRGKFLAEKRKAKAAIEAKEARDEDGGWEDEDEEDDEDGWSDGDDDDDASLTASPKQIPPPAPTPLRKMSKRQREQAEAERAKIEAELEAQRKREMFAKQAIFGQQRTGGLLKQELQRGGSMVDLTAHPATSSSVQRGFSDHRQSPAPGSNMLRSKSAVAIPVQTGVSVTIRSQLGGSGTNDSPSEQNVQSGSASSGQAQAQGRAGPSRQPQGPSRASVEAQGQATGPTQKKTQARTQAPTAGRSRLSPQDYLESTDEDSDADNYLATSSTQRKLEALVTKRNKAPSPQPVPVASPTTDRRGMIMREMSESLRRNLILERQKSSTNLAKHNTTQSQDRPPPIARPSVLGGGFLRPLTRVGHGHGNANANANGAGASTTAITRTQSTATLVGSHSHSPSGVTLGPAIGHGQPEPQAPPMMRSNTEGGRSRAGPSGTNTGLGTSVKVDRSELQRRSETMDTSYRMHGW